jgi:hypothetical protein
LTLVGSNLQLSNSPTLSSIAGYLNKIIFLFLFVGKAYGILWEKAENIQFCRGCQVKFPPLLISKHHCRRYYSVVKLIYSVLFITMNYIYKLAVQESFVIIVVP